MRAPLLALTLLAAACAPGEPAPEADRQAPAASDIETATDLLQAMHDRYGDTWYETVTFRQATISHHPGGTADTATWHEAMKAPGRLRIDIGGLADANGMLFRNDSLYAVEAGAVETARPLIHPLLVLGFDVYRQPVERTVAQLEALGHDLSVMHEDTWQGRPALVVGAPPGDTTSMQFWVDRDRLLTVRTIRPGGADPGSSVRDVRFDDYEPLGEAWISPMMRFYADGRLVSEEVYTEIRRDVPLPDSLFDPSAWRITAPYWE